MSMRVIKRALGLLIVDIVLIIGIFVLQFRTDSTIIEKIGNLQVSLELNENQEDEKILKNKLQISYNGLNLFCNDQNPAQISYSNSDEKKSLILQSYEKGDLSYKFNFSDDVSFTVAISSQESNADFSTFVELPSNVSNFYLPYNFNYNMKIQKEDDSKIVVDGKKSSWEISAANLSPSIISYTKNENSTHYAIYDDTVTQFSFELLAQTPFADNLIYLQNVENLKTNLISAFKTNSSSLTEQIVVSYIAAQSENGNYVSAIEEIPTSFKNGNSRTYLSSPYLNNLARMNVLLDNSVSENENLITNANSNFDLNLFTTKNLAFYMYIYPNKNVVNSVLQKAATSDIENASLMQVSGILRTYTELFSYDKNLALILSPVLENCVQKIENLCNYDQNILTISENDTFVSVIQAVEIGVSLLRYGNLIGNQTYIKSGYVIINSYINETSSFDLRTLCNLYSILAYDNSYYPHFKKIETNDNQKIWAWTCAKDITYSSQSENSISLRIDFPENYTHYVIFKGIPRFRTIYIYDMAFRTDPRFETYNSSGYVYNRDSEILLLKSRHKQRFETVRFDLYDENYVEPARQNPVVQTQPVATEQTQTVEEQTITTEESIKEETAENLSENETTEEN